MWYHPFAETVEHLLFEILGAFAAIYYGKEKSSMVIF